MTRIFFRVQILCSLNSCDANGYFLKFLNTDNNLGVLGIVHTFLPSTEATKCLFTGLGPG